MQLTIKVKARQYPLWQYAVAGLLAVLGSAFWAWVFYIAFGFGPSVARQVFFVFSAVQLIFLPIMYFAYERQFRNHRSRAVQTMASCFAASLAFAALYFIMQFPLGTTVKVMTITLVAASILLGVIVSIFLIRYEFE